MASSSPIEVVAAIIQKDGKFLITKRLERSHLGHCWEFPGGKLHPGESLEECAIRECREEIDVEIKPLRKIREVWHNYPEKSVHLHFFICDLVSGSPRSVECADFRWALPEELSRFEFPEADREIVEELTSS